ncbi:MAG: hypothetical protein C0614_09180 [Desulfuromonas sp.]|nr:MAG: hypothetical protein C0614_09180 [Desulfuromonas sp.]
MKQLSLLILILWMTWASAMAADPVSRIAAVVNDDIITTYQLEQALQKHLATQDKAPSPAQLGAVRRELLSRLIEETLVKQRIATLKLTVSEEEIETAILDVQKQNKLTREDLEQAVRNQGLSFSIYRENLRQQILRYKLISADVRSKVDITEQEIVEYYRAHLEEYRSPAKIELSALSFPLAAKSDQFQREAVVVTAKEAAGRLRDGEPLETVAATLRDDYAASSLNLGAMVFSEMSPEFTAALESVAEGDYSDPVQSGNAVFILKVDGREPGRLRPFEAAKGEIYQMISDQKTDAQLKEWTRGLKRQAFIDVRL